VTEAILSISVGVALVLFGAGLWMLHIRTWKVHQNDPVQDARGWRHYKRQCRRRLLVAGILMLLGVLIPAGDLLIPWRRFPRLFVAYWGGILLLAVWIILLGIFDGISGRLHLRAMLSRLSLKQRELEEEMARLRQQTKNHEDRADE
jgi:hypothetical protein